MFNKLLSSLLLAGLVFVLPLSAQSATYYVSSSTGNDANDGQSKASPWQTLAKVNEIKFEDNSTILFKRGDLFRGEISAYKFPIGLTFGAYSSGDNPVIAGSVEITGWSKTTHPKLGSTVYEADVSAFIVEDSKGNVNTIEHLFVNGELMTIARYPNVNSPAEKNWLKVGATAGTGGFTDPALVAYNKPDDYWKGATLRIRNYSWTYTVSEITGYRKTNGKITASRLGDQLPEWGYFLDDKLEELDHPGEWYYDAQVQKVYFYPKNGANPNNLLVEGSTFAKGISISSDEHNTIVENLTFRHFTDKGVSVGGSDDCIVRNNHFEHNVTGVSAWNSANVLITNNTFNHQLMKSIALSASSDFDVQNSVVEKNQMTNTAMYPLYGRRYDGVYQGIGISVFGRAYTVRQNTIENTSHAGMNLKNDGHHLIENNVIRRALLLLNDGGAVVIGANGNRIIGNFLLETVGNVDESNGCGSTTNDPCMHHPSYGMGIGANNNFKDNVIEGNTVANNVHQGIRLNAFINTTVRNNVIYNNKNQIVIEDKKGPSHSNVVEGNIIYPLHPDQIGLSLTNDTNHGSFDNNFYCNPYSEVVVIREKKRYALAHWQSAFAPLDKKSKSCGLLNFEQYSVSNVGADLILNSTFDANVSNWSNKAIFDANKAEMDGGSLKAVHPGTASNLNISPNNLAFVANQLYRLKFSIIGNGFGNINLRINDKNAEVRILKGRYFAYDTTRKDYEMFFLSPNTTTGGQILFITKDYDADTYWLDNVTFEPVDATLNDATKKSVLFTNMTAENPKTISLGSKTYLDLEGNSVTGSITLAAFSSQILIFTGNAPPSSVKLTLDKAGAGSGQVTSQPAGIDCGADCDQSYTSGTAITLTATPNGDSTFAGFSGDVNCSESFTITADMNCTATFNLQPTPVFQLSLQKDGTGSGVVNSQPAGIDCGADCDQSYTSGTAITLTATPGGDSTFAGFSGDANCSESFTITADMNCTATFNLATTPLFQLSLQKAGTGSGVVSSQPAGIDCGADCTESYQSGTAMTLTATPTSGSTFVGFSGDANCAESFTLTADMNCTATFNKEVVTPPPTYTLTIETAGTGSGQVTSQPAGIDCGSDCTESYQSGTAITLTATPDSGSTFAGFSGDANCAESFTLTADMNCTATFNKVVTPPNYTLIIQTAGTGSGQVSSQPAGIDCGSDCTESYQSGTAITLTATPTSGSTFVGFSGDANCAESFTLTADMNCTATFNKEVVTPPPTYTLTIQTAGTGSGQVTSQPAGIDCGSDCTASYQSNTAITLTATPEAGSTFAGFSGDANCSESFTITAEMNCTATYNKIVVTPPNYTLTIQNAGTGSGQVTSQPAGIDCGSDCTESYQSNTTIILTAAPESDSTFAGFSGDANCAESFTLTADMNCTATFNLLPPPPPNYTLTIQKTGMGAGHVSSQPGGIDCGTDCTANYQSGTVVVLTATPATNDSAFIDWRGDCSGFETSVTVTMEEAKNCRAHFDFVAFPTVPGPFETPNCLDSGLFYGVCNAVGQAHKDVTIGTEGHVSNVVLKGIITNHGWISNAVIEPQATLRGGIVTGYITNQGTMSGFEFRGAKVTGGALSGVITNTRGGTFKNVHLKAKTRLSGGKLAGKITGESDARLENLEIQAGCELSDVVLGDNVQLPFDVKLGKGVRFTNNQLIPQELELADLLPSLPESLDCADQVTQLAPVDLSTDVLWESDGILKAINQLPAFYDQGWQITQDPFGLQLTVDVLHFAVHPFSVKPTTGAAMMQVQDTQSTRFITNTGRDILTQPAIQAPCDLQTALAGFDLPQFVVQPNGNLKIPAKADNWYSARPDLASVEVAKNKTLGMFFSDSPLVSGVQQAYLVFTDAHDKQREQLFYPALALPDALSASAQQVVIRYDGFVSFRLKGKTFSGVVDYLITQSTPSTTNKLQVKSQPDMNGDGIADLVLLYPTGEQQILFAVPGDN